MSSSPSRLSKVEKIGYGLGDVATNFFFMSMILYQNRFYTDTVGLSAGAVGTLLLCVRFLDAIVDPVIGALSDRTKSRWGKFRPWVLLTAIPFGLVFWLVYRTPDLGPSGKMIYACVTYILVMMLYSANNTPYAALMGVMTPDASERASIASYRFVAAMIGQFLIQALAQPLVDKFGHGSSARGWSATMAIFGAAMAVCYLITFATTRERVIPNPTQKSSLKDDLKEVFTCKPWIVMFLLTLLLFTTIALRGSALNYLFAYYMDQNAVKDFLGHVGLGATSVGAEGSLGKSALDALGLLVKPDGSNAASVGLSFFLVLGNVIQIVGILLSKPLAERFGKKNVFLAGLSLTTLATLLVYYVTPTSMSLMVVLSVLWPLGWGPTVPLLWVMIADAADYSEWKSQRRATGFMYAGILFALKAGLGLGGALAGWIMGAYGYVANVAQTPQSLLGIRLSATVFSTIPFFIALLCLTAYPISKQLNSQIEADLVERRKRFGQS